MLTKQQPFFGFVLCVCAHTQVGEGMSAPLPKVAVLGDDGQMVGVEEEPEDEAVQAERRMIEGRVR
eukprot:COSAG06_NODE_1126_length_10609_cov_228.247383_3_plen_66_part_00